MLARWCGEAISARWASRAVSSYAMFSEIADQQHTTRKSPVWNRVRPPDIEAEWTRA